MPTVPPLRPQYHLRASSQGLLAWDVRLLIAQAAAEQLPAHWVALSAIAELDERYWFTEPGDEPTPRAIAAHLQLVAAADTRYPILLDAQGRIMDGMHRVLQRLSQGHDSVWAQQFTTTPAPHFVGVPADQLPYGDTP